MTETTLKTEVWVDAAMSMDDLLARISPARDVHTDAMACEEALESGDVKGFMVTVTVSPLT